MYKGSGGRMPLTLEREEELLPDGVGEMGVEWNNLPECGSKVTFSVVKTLDSRVYFSLATVKLLI